MITIKNVKTLSGSIETFSFKHEREQEIDAQGKWISIPGLIDAHVNFSSSGQKQWPVYAKKALFSGVTRVFDLPTGSFDCFNLDQLKAKKTAIDAALREQSIPLNYQLYMNANQDSIEELSLSKSHAIAIYVSFDPKSKVFIADNEALERLFQLAAQKDLMIAASEDAKKAISLAEKYGAQVYLLNTHSEADLKQIQEAKAKQLLVYAETTPYHLFQSESQFLWEAIHNGTIDSIGSNAGSSRDAIEIEMFLPLLLHAVNEGKLSLEKVVQMTRINVETIYGIDRQKDLVLVDMTREKRVALDFPLSINGNTLKGAPVYTFFKDQLYPAL